MSNYNKKRIYIVLVFFLICSVVTFAQTRPCKAKIRANRNVVISSEFLGFNTIRLDCYYPKAEGTKYYHNNNSANSNKLDSILIKVRGLQVSKLTLPRENIVEYKNINYYKFDAGDFQGDELMDSFSLKSNYLHWNAYFDSYKWQGVIWTKNKKENSILYYKINGDDSVFYQRYPNGILKQKIVTDSFEYYSSQEFNQQGVLISNWIKNGDRVSNNEYTNGILQTSRIDTFIKPYGLLKFQKEYYLNGVIKTEKFFSPNYPDSIPCLVWKYYNKDGVLEKTEQKSKEIRSYIIEPIQERDRFPCYKEEFPRYRGGIKTFLQQINSNLQDILCESKITLRGVYFVNFYIDKDGSCSAFNITGLNAFELQHNNLFRMFDRWSPGNINEDLNPKTVIATATIRIDVEKE